MDEAIAVIAKAQRADGYIHTPVLIANRNGDATAKPFQDRLNFEMYNMGHLITAACVHHRATGKTTLLDVARKAADFLCDAFAKPTPELARNAVCPSHYMGVVELYRTTGDPKYLRPGGASSSTCATSSTGGTDDNQDRIPFRQQTEAVGHAVRANYLYAGAADVYAETGDETLLRAAAADLGERRRARRCTSPAAAGRCTTAPRPTARRTRSRSPASTRPTAATTSCPTAPPTTRPAPRSATCCGTGGCSRSPARRSTPTCWSWRSTTRAGRRQPRRQAVLLHQHAAPARPDAGAAALVADARAVHQLLLLPAERRPHDRRRSSSYAYGRSDRGVWVHLYGGSTLDTDAARRPPLKLTQETDYPWDGRVKITIEAAPAGEVSLFLRIPGWATGATLARERQAGATATAGRYAEIRRAVEGRRRRRTDLPMRRGWSRPTRSSRRPATRSR